MYLPVNNTGLSTTELVIVSTTWFILWFLLGITSPPCDLYHLLDIPCY